MLDQRMKRNGRAAAVHGLGRRNANRRMTSTDLMQIYQREAEKQRILVKKSDFTQTRLLFIVEALRDLLSDDGFTTLLRAEQLETMHRMVVKAVERGVPEARIAEALGLDIATIRRRFRLLDGICPEVVEMLKDVACPMKVFDELRRMTTIRQIEAADLMVGQNNFTVPFAKALLAATPDNQLVKQPRKRRDGANAISTEQMTRMERELAALQAQVKSVEETYGLDNLHLTVTRGYIAKLLGNARIVRWLSQNRQEYLGEFQRIAEIDSISPAPTPVQE